jgi:putative addiction module component (TIGR02574 family)
LKNRLCLISYIYYEKENDMNISLPLDKMTSLDKIAVMEKLWDDLCQDPESIPSPSWHKDILEAREKEIKEGKAEFKPFDRAKERIRDQVK